MILFSKLYRQLDVDICLYVKRELPPMDFPVAIERISGLDLWDRFFIESEANLQGTGPARFGFLIESGFDDDGEYQMSASLYGARLDGLTVPMSVLDVAEVLRGGSTTTNEERATVLWLAKVMSFIDSLARAPQDSPIKDKRDRKRALRKPPVEVYAPKENSTIYRKLTHADVARHIEGIATARKEALTAAEIEARKRGPYREHSVRGHWRTYKSGKRVWIKGHSRGKDRHRVVKILEV